MEQTTKEENIYYEDDNDGLGDDIYEDIIEEVNDRRKSRRRRPSPRRRRPSPRRRPGGKSLSKGLSKGGKSLSKGLSKGGKSLSKVGGKILGPIGFLQQGVDRVINITRYVFIFAWLATLNEYVKDPVWNSSKWKFLMFMSVLNIGLTIYSLFKKYGESGVSAFFSWDAIKRIFFMFLFIGVIYLYGPKFDHTDPETIEKLKNNPFIKFWKRIQVLIMFIYGFLAVYTVVITIFPFIIMIPVIGQIIMFIGGFLGLFF